MSEDWKNERAEASMREGTEAIRKAAEKKAEEQELLKWDEFKNSLLVGHENHKESISIYFDTYSHLR